MGVYLYCIGPVDLPSPPDLSGVDAAPVCARDLAGFRLWVSQRPDRPRPSLEGVRSHHDVVEAATGEVTPLPVRFGQWCEDEAALLAMLEQRAPAIRRGLKRVAGAREFAVRVIDRSGGTGAPKAPPDRSSGRAYLRSLAGNATAAATERRRGAEVASALQAELGALVREQRVRPAGGALIAISHLVDRHDTGTYSEGVERFAAGNPRLRFIRAGPWPPYGFVDDAH